MIYRFFEYETSRLYLFVSQFPITSSVPLLIILWVAIEEKTELVAFENQFVEKLNLVSLIENGPISKIHMQILRLFKTRNGIVFDSDTVINELDNNLDMLANAFEPIPQLSFKIFKGIYL